MGPLLGIGAAALGLLVDQMGKAEKAAVESAKADAVLNSVLTSTGGVVGMTEGRLSDLANQISVNAGLDDELVKSGEAVLLTFTRIGSDVFPQTMQAAADMAAVLGGDLNGKITMVGKAMNDFSGYTALKRAGVSFTEEQIKQIANFKATNDLVGYQQLLLKELQTEYGGAAKKVNDAGDGSENMNIAVGNLRETIGAKLIPAQRAWNNLLTDAANGITNAINKSDQYTDTIERLGISYGPVAHGQQVVYTYMRDGIEITEEQRDAFIAASNAAEVATDRYDEMAPAIQATGVAAELSEEQIKELTDTNKNMISMTEKFVDITKMSAEEAQIATHKIVLGYLEQQIAQDGLSTAETEFLLQKGVEWGIYSDTAIEAMRSAMTEADNLAASINGIPSQKDITIRTIYESLTSVGAGVSVARAIANGIASGEGLKHPSGPGGANGMDMIVPAGYPNDSFPLRAQSGEHVQITPAGQNSDPELVGEIRSLRNEMKSFARETGDAMGVKLMQLGLV